VVVGAHALNRAVLLVSGKDISREMYDASSIVKAPVVRSASFSICVDMSRIVFGVRVNLLTSRFDVSGVVVAIETGPGQLSSQQGTNQEQ
jgi:hypothetical protein